MIRNPFGRLTFRSVVVAVLILLGIGFVVWQSPRFAYAGRTPFATPVGRAWLTVALCALWLAGWGIAVLMRRITRVRIMWDTAPTVPPTPAPNEDRSAAAALQRLDELFLATLRLLRRDGPIWRLRRHSLYRMPWYLLLGPEGSGKTALMTSSRLKFSRQDENVAARPDDPCRFWLGDQAVLLEAGGKLGFPGTQPDSAYPVWRRLLTLLRRARRRCPVNGVIITISVTDLLADEPDRVARARGLRGRLSEMQRLFDVQFPVYVVVTHCDRLAGFEPFFQHLDRPAADQTWGVTFAGVRQPTDDAPLAAFPTEFDALVRRLQDRIVHLIGTGGDAARAGKVYGFPAQFEAIGEPLGAFLVDVFGKSPYTPTSWLRGVYFTSAAQDGEDTPRRASVLAAAIQGSAMPEHKPASNSHGYFIARMLGQVVFREHQLAGRPLLSMWRPGVLRYLMSVLLVALVAAAGGILYAAYQRNLTMIALMNQNTQRLESLATGLETHGSVASESVEILNLLDMARQPATPPGLSMASALVLRRMGLYQGKMLDDAVLSTYHTLLWQTLLPFVRARAQRTMTDSMRDYVERFDALRAYLMMGDSHRFQLDAMLAWVEQDLRQSPLSKTQRADMLTYVRDLFEMPDVWTHVSTDATLVARVRADLTAQPLVDRLYGSLTHALRAAVPDTLSVAKLGGTDAPLVLHRESGRPLSEGVPGIYTLTGYRRYLVLRDKLIVDAERDRWVLGTVGAEQPAGARLRSELDSDYFSHYIAAWDELLNDVRAGNIGADARDSAADMHLLAASDSPLRRFLQSAAAQTTLAGIPDPASSTPELGGSGTAAGTGGAEPVEFDPEGAKRVPTVTKASTATTMVDAHFDALHQLFQGSDGQAPPFADVQAKLGAAAVFMDAVDAARQRGLPPPPADAIRSLQLSAEGQPAPLGDMLRDLASDGRIVASDDMRRRLNDLWRATVAPFCHAALDGRYPIDASSTQDMTQDDFNRLLGPGGLIDAFFQTNLLSYVDMSAHPWRWRPNGVKLGLSRSALQIFEDAATIRLAFFPDGQKTMSVRFQLLPLSLDPYFTRFDLMLGGRTLEYDHGPARPVSFLWPDNSGTLSAGFDYEPAGPDGRSGASVSGPWALFRLLDMGTLERVRADRFILSFTLSGKPVSLELDAGSVINPFALSALHRFHCLDQLTAPGSDAKRPVPQASRTLSLRSPPA